MELANGLRLDEYDLAGREFFGEAVNAVARASNPILGQIQRETVEVLPPTLSTVDSGEIVRRDPHLASAAISLSVVDGIQGDFADVQRAIAEAADQMVSSIMPSIYQHIGEICDATGNVVEGAGRPIWEMMIESLETIAISFDEDGNPNLPSIVMDPDTADRVGEPPDDYLDRFNEVIARRKDEWLAGRRTRVLPRLSQ